MWIASCIAHYAPSVLYIQHKTETINSIVFVGQIGIYNKSIFTKKVTRELY